MATRAKAAPIRVKMSEEQLKNAVVDYATSLGWKVFHIPDWMYRLALMSMKRTMRNDRKWSPPGFPDLVLMQGLHDTREPARLIFVELKVEKGVFSSPEQYDWVKGLRRIAGVETYVWTPSDWKPLDGGVSNVEKILNNGPMADHPHTEQLLARKRPAEKIR